MTNLKFMRIFQSGLVMLAILVVKPAFAEPGPAAVLQADDFKHYVDTFNKQDPEKVVHLIPNAQSWSWMKQNTPIFACPDAGIEEMYYFRWWSYRKAIVQLDHIALTEFLPRGPVSSAVGHHVSEGRWLHDNKYIDQDLLYWLDGPMPHDKDNYSSWTIWAAYHRYMVNMDRKFIVGMLDDFIRNYESWGPRHFLADQGMYQQLESQDAMEDSINGDRRQEGLRPTINSYMYGNASAIAAIATLAGKPDIAREYQAKADALKKNVLTKLWDPQANFFKVRWLDGTFSHSREAVGFIPWYFELPDKGYEAAWAQFIDPKGFWAPFGMTTAERRDPKFRTHGSGHSCEWDGPVWPFATAQALTALANVLNDYPQQYVSKENYLEALQTYAKSQHLDGKPYIGEYLDETTGLYLRRDLERGRFYNHSTFCDLVISGLVGIRPEPDQTLVVNPLVPPGKWDWFCLDNVLYHGKTLTIVWDRTGQKFGKGKGLTVLADGKQIAHADQLERVTADLGK